MIEVQAEAVASYGKLQQARELFRRALETAERGNFKDTASGILARQALIESAFGNAREARDGASPAVNVARSRSTLRRITVALALAGDLAGAQRVIDDLAKRYPTATLVNQFYLPTSRAAVELRRGNPARAIELLRTTGPYENANFRTFYIRGQAYLSLKAGAEAAAEFQHILDHRGIGPFSPIYFLARLGLARALALAGERDRSHQTYQEFLTLWKDADQNIPVLIEAQREASRLQ
jgi:tetratricopeptide (TPR) repeat protein